MTISHHVPQPPDELEELIRESAGLEADDLVADEGRGPHGP
ncbi:hypothetical protein ACQEVG_37685 [Streptomyces sp. CA-135486]